MKYNYVYNNNSDERVVGFAAPFILGALTGGVTYAAFNPYRPRPTYPYNNNNYGNTYNPYGVNYYSGYNANYPYYY